MSRRRIVVALLFTAAGITPLAALGVAWGGQGWTVETTVTVDGRAAESFPTTPTTPTSSAAVAAAPKTPGAATQAAVGPHAADPPAATGAPKASADGPKAPADGPKPRPTGKPTADPEPTTSSSGTATPDPTGQPSEGGS